MPAVAPRIPKRALTPILGVGVAALAVVTILVAANNPARPRLDAAASPAVSTPPTAVAPSRVDPGPATAAPGVSAPAPSRSARPRASASPESPDDVAVAVWRSSDDVTIPDGVSEANSVLAVSGRHGNAPPGVKVWVDIKHKVLGDLVVDLIGPSGRAFALPVSGIGVNLNAVYTVDASTEPCSGKWRLRVRDLKSDGSVGYLDNWSIDFS